ncbi:MAG TPA: hypothetical protein VI078_01120 [bacterium]
MPTRLDELLEEIRALEAHVQEELERRQEQFRYRIVRRKVIFERELAELHRKYAGSVIEYLFRARLLTVLTAPVIYTMIVPAALFDLAITIYQQICFRAYGIPRVRRRDHFILDRHYLKYLNVVERLNCDYCSYFNGLASYATEIGARTEQYWCPIKHAAGKGARNSRSRHFVDYGDAAAYRERLEAIRRQFEDAA